MPPNTDDPATPSADSDPRSGPDAGPEPRSLNRMATVALAEIGAVLDRALPQQARRMGEAILTARRIALHGVGREGLMMRALAMRLHHMGLDAHVVGDMTAPPLGPGDLLIASAGPGALPTVSALIEVARGTGAATLCVTAEPDGPTARLADTIVHLPAQTMASDRPDDPGRDQNAVLASHQTSVRASDPAGGQANTQTEDQGGGQSLGSGALSVLPMGSLFEAAQFLFFELLVLDLRDRAGIDPEEMRANHTNLE